MNMRSTLDSSSHPKLAELKEMPLDLLDIGAEGNASLFFEKDAYLNTEYTNESQVKAIYLHALEQHILETDFIKIKNTDFGYLIIYSDKTIAYAHLDQLLPENQANFTRNLRLLWDKMHVYSSRHNITINEFRYTQIIQTQLGHNSSHWISIGVSINHNSLTVVPMDSLLGEMISDYWKTGLDTLSSVKLTIVSKPAPIAHQRGNTCGFHAAINAAAFGLKGSPKILAEQNNYFFSIMDSVNRQVLSKKCELDLRQEDALEFAMRLKQFEMNVRNPTEIEKAEYKNYIESRLAAIGSLAEEDASIKIHHNELTRLYAEKMRQSPPDHRKFITTLKNKCDEYKLSLSIETNLLKIISRAIPINTPSLQKIKSTKNTNGIEPLYSQIPRPGIIEYIFQDKHTAEVGRANSKGWESFPIIFDTALQKYKIQMTARQFGSEEFDKFYQIDGLRKQNRFQEIISGLPEKALISLVAFNNSICF